MSIRVFNSQNLPYMNPAVQLLDRH